MADAVPDGGAHVDHLRYLTFTGSLMAAGKLQK
jgi:hypothetical protein